MYLQKFQTLAAIRRGLNECMNEIFFAWTVEFIHCKKFGQCENLFISDYSDIWSIKL